MMMDVYDAKQEWQPLKGGESLKYESGVPTYGPKPLFKI
jgi:hypothetical protein